MLSIVRKNYYMKIYADETKVSLSKSENPVRIKSVINERKLQQVLYFNYFGFIVGFDKREWI